MEDKRNPPGPGSFNQYDGANGYGCRPQEQYNHQYTGPYNNNNNSYPPFDSTTGQGIATPTRCNATPSVSQFQHPDTRVSPMKSYWSSATGGGSPNYSASTQSSYASPTAATRPKFDPFGYHSRTPQNNIHQRPNQNPSSRPFYDDHQLHHPHHQHQQQIRPAAVGLGGPPPSAASGGGFPPRPHQHQPPPPHFFPPGGGFRPQQQQHHFQPGNRGPFYPSTGGSAQAASTISDFQQQVKTALSASNFDDMSQQQHPPPAAPFMFDGAQAAGPMTNGHMAMNGTGGGGGGIEFNEDFSGNGMDGASPAQYVLSNELLEKIQASGKRKALLELQIGLEQIAYDPSNIFETWATVIKDRLVGTDPLPDSDLHIAAGILVEMAVVLDDSQYNYSRLGQFLCRSISNFAVNFLLHQVSTFITDTNTFLSEQHSRNLVLFLAELYDKLDINGVKSSELAAHLFDQLRNLLKLGPISDQTVNVMVKVLKLVGRFLENDRGSEATTEFLNEFDQAVQNSTSTQLSELAKEKVRNLLTLRQKNWGMVAETNHHNGTAPTSVGIIGPDGEQLTEDECAFMEENLDTFGNSPAGSQGATAFDEDNVEDDYEKFLQATAIRAAEKALEKASIDEDDDESVLSSPKSK